MKPYYEDGPVTVFHGDCVEVLATLDDASVDAVCTDPPYALEFMGRGWDKFTPLEFELWVSQWAAECLRVLKPGGHMLAFGGSRTWHRLAAGIEDAGFEIRDSIAWLYGSGFPKSLDVSKAIDAAAGATRDVVGSKAVTRDLARNGRTGDEAISPVPVTGTVVDITAPATDAAKTWEGWGTALKPAFEPVVVARKPLVGTVAGNVLAYGTGALNIGATRVAHGGDVDLSKRQRQTSDTAGFGGSGMKAGHEQALYAEGGRWPTNVVLDESQAAELDRQSGVSVSPSSPVTQGKRRAGSGWDRPVNDRTEGLGVGYGDAGGASRFFPTFRYEAKAPTSERPKAGDVQHPTVKPLDLMRWLVRLVTPAGGVVLEPFAGSGTTIEAAVLEGFKCIGIEREADYLPLIERRLAKPMQQGLFDDLEGIA